MSVNFKRNVQTKRATMSRVLFSFFFIWGLPWLLGGCGHNACTKMGLDKIDSHGIFGCYYDKSWGGGYTGETFQTDGKSCIVLRPDSSLEMYTSDTLTFRKRFTVYWENVGKNRQYGKIIFVPVADRSGTVYTVSEEGWIGVGNPQFKDSFSTGYKKCCK